MTTSELIADEPRLPREPDGEELRSEARALFWKRLTQAAFVAALVVLLGFQAWNVALIRETQVGNRTTLKQAQQAANAAKTTAHRIEDCTTPGGDCFERAQRQTSGAVAGINTITVRTAACMTVILKQYPAGTTVNVDGVAEQIKQCIQSTTAAVKPQRVVPAPKPLRPKATAAHPGAPQSPEPSPAPASPGHTATPTPTGTPTGSTTSVSVGLSVDLGPVCDVLPAVCTLS